MSFPFEIVDIRFFFNNGQKQFTVEYTPSIFMWFVFSDRADMGCVYKKEIEKLPKIKDLNLEAAREILLEYLETVPAI